MYYLLHKGSRSREQVRQISRKAGEWYDEDMDKLVRRVDELTNEDIVKIVNDEGKTREERDKAYETLAERLSRWLKNFLGT